jgi:WD40 repeat protein
MTTPALGEDGVEDKETWRIKHMCRSLGSEIYDLAWSPDGVYFITGSMDNIARIYNAQNGSYSPTSPLPGSRDSGVADLFPLSPFLFSEQARSSNRSLSTTTTSRALHGTR